MQLCSLANQGGSTVYATGYQPPLRCRYPKAARAGRRHRRRLAGLVAVNEAETEISSVDVLSDTGEEAVA